MEQKFGEFAIIEKLGQGAMGAVYKARQISLNRIVALKLLPGRFGGDSDSLSRFKNEAMAAASLNHPNIVQVYAAGEDHGTHYFAMEYVEGESLGARLERKGRIEPRGAVAIACHLVRALNYAWKKAQVIHRDIKPDNIFLSHEGDVKLGDLGLVKMLGEQDSRLTQTGAAMGTPYYVSPEQALGVKEIDFRTDIYSLGCTLFHSVAGATPYQGESAMSVMMQHISQPAPKIQAVWPACPPALAELLDRMLCKRPEERHESYEALLEQLFSVAERLDQPSPAEAAAASLIVPMPVPHSGSAPDLSRRPSSAANSSQPKPAPRAVRAGKAPLVFGVIAVVGISLLAWHAWKKSAMAPSGGVATAETPAKKMGAAIPSATKDAPFVNSLGMRLVPVPGADVLMCIHETRRKDYAVYAAENPGVDGTWKAPLVEGQPLAQQEDHPVVMVSWQDATAFCAWLSRKEGRLYRLPTEHEWNLAVVTGLDDPKAVSQADLVAMLAGQYPWGTTKVEDAVHYGNYNGNADGYDGTAPVMSFLPNHLGIYDLGGNAWEWCEDWFNADHKQRVLRGCGYRNQSVYRHSGTRVGAEPDFRTPPQNDFSRRVPGFRIVATNLPVASINATAAAPKDAPFVNSLGMKFVPVPIVSGPTAGQRVLFSVWDTRVQDYEAFIKETSHEWPKMEFAQGPTHPAVKVSWEDAQLFCQWLTRSEKTAGRLPEGFIYRLPADHEWSCAVGIGAREDSAKLPGEKSQSITDAFPWGTEWPPPRGSGNYAGEELRPAIAAGKYTYANVIAGYNDGFENTSPVGSFAANQFGLFDMGGNVWQWCEDWMEKGHMNRMLRGGSWDNDERARLLSSFRRYHGPSVRLYNYGFRCVLAPETPASIRSSSSGSATSPTNGVDLLVSSSSATPSPPKPPSLMSSGRPPATPTPKPMPTSTSETEKWLTQMDAIYQAMYSREVTAPFENGMAEVKKNYLAALDHENASASLAANLNAALAFRNEHQRVQAGSEIPSDDSDAPPAPLKSLRAAYRIESARLESDRRKHTATVFAQYDKVLATNQTALTQRQRLDEALLLQRRRDALGKAWGISESVPATSPLEKSAPPPSGAFSTATKDKPFVNTFGMKFVPVPGTDILMCIHETRRMDYGQYAAENPAASSSWKAPLVGGTVLKQEDNHPVIKVSCADAAAFCAWLSKKESHPYRLPTEREWELAVVVGVDDPRSIDQVDLTKILDSIYPWGSPHPKPAPKYGNYVGSEDGYEGTAPVMSFLPNHLGIYDLGGNAWEWCVNTPEHGSGKAVLRGCDFTNMGPYRKASTREVVPSHTSAPIGEKHHNPLYSGFRCVLEIGPPGQ